MTDFKLIATAAFGLEGIVSRELDWLGAADKTAENGRVRFSGDLRMVARANLWLRTADRVLILLAEGKVTTFEELFQLVSQIPFEELMPADACFPVTGKSVKSTLFSVPRHRPPRQLPLACQSPSQSFLLSTSSSSACLEESY